MAILVLMVFFATASFCQAGDVMDGRVHIPAGKFIMGSDKVDTEMLQQRFGMRNIPYQNEHPQRSLYLGEFYIDKFEVTNRQYKEYVRYARTNVPIMTYLRLVPRSWEEGTYEKGKGENPVVEVNWHNAKAYCQWRGGRLPTEAEWEKAARGTDGREFVWGGEFDDKKANTMGINGSTAPVGTFKGDKSPYGVYDMTGNVSEWVDDWYVSYPGNKYQSKDYGSKFKVVRGWDWGGIGHYILDLFYRTSFRNYKMAEEAPDYVGFRCAYSE